MKTNARHELQPKPVKLPTEPWEGQGAAKSGFSGEGQRESDEGAQEDGK
jgi:hypothetical protein